MSSQCELTNQTIISIPTKSWGLNIRSLFENKTLDFRIDRSYQLNGKFVVSKVEISRTVLFALTSHDCKQVLIGAD